MGVQLDEGEIEVFLTHAHTMILSTLRQSGAPFMVPMWFVYMDEALYFSTPSNSGKVKHMTRDARVSCLIEEGMAWIDLKAVLVSGTAVFVDSDSDEALRFLERYKSKYAEFRPKMKRAPEATKQHYAGQSSILKVELANSEVRTWYNRKIRGMASD